MNKTSDKDERYPFVHVRTPLMEAVSSDTKLSDTFTALNPEKDKTIALQNMKDKMMEKAALNDGNDESPRKPTKSPAAMKTTSQAISALAHQVGMDDDILTLRINKRHIDPSTKSTAIYSTLSLDNPNRNGLDSVIHSRRTL